MKCSACKIVAHTACIDILIDRVQFTCKPTFRDVGVRQYREQTLTHHHWVHRRSEKGKCKACGKVINLDDHYVMQCSFVAECYCIHIIQLMHFACFFCFIFVSAISHTTVYISLCRRKTPQQTSFINSILHV